MRTVRALLRQLSVSFLFGLVVAVSLEYVGRTELFEKTELLTLDFRYRVREAPEFRSDVGYVDFDDTSIARFGRWVWPRNRQVTLVNMLDRYDAEALGYDVFFSERSEIVFDAAKAFDTAAGLAPEARASAAFRDHDAEFEAAMLSAGSIYLAQFMVQPDSTIASGDSEKVRQNIRAYIEATRPHWTAEKHEALAYASQYARDADSITEEMLYKAVDMVAPLGRFGSACAGIGYAQIVKDLDQTVRLYPLFMYYDGHVFPSIAVVMLSRILNVPMEAIRIQPGEFIEFPDAELPRAGAYPQDGGTPSATGGAAETLTIRIPVDKNGQMLVNWGGGFYERGLHLSFSHLARFAAENAAREATLAFPPASEAFARSRAAATAAAAEDDLVTDDEARTLGEEAALARFIEPRILAGEDPAAAAAAVLAAREVLGLASDDRAVERIARVLALAERHASGETTAQDAELGEDWSAAVGRTVAFWRAREGVDAARPLWVPPPIRVPWNGIARPFTAVDLEKKILMAGLTGVGTIDLNPMPFDNDCPMVALHTSALNTILTNKFLEFSSDDERRIFLYAMTLAAALLCGLLSPAKAFFACAAMVGGFSWHVWESWTVDGEWVHWVEPIVGVVAIYIFEAVVSFVQAAREKQKVRGIFSTMVSPKVLKLMEDNPDKFSLTGERKPATMFFSAIDGFGKVTQREAPEELGAILGQYLTPCSELILEYDGYIDKYEGHVIMADFGVPLDDPDHAWKCCFAAIEQQMDIEAFRTFVLARYGTEVRVSMGINSGFVSAGNMGSEKKMQYTVMGDAVNVAARFRPANGIYGTGIITGEATEPFVRQHLELRMLDRLLLKGKTKPTTLYEVMGWKPDSYRSLRGNRPVPESVLVRWLRCPPHKVYGYRAWWRVQAETWKLPLASRIADFFESQEPLMAEIVVAGAILSLRRLEAEMNELAEHVQKIEGFQEQEAAAAPSALGWKERLSAWQASVELVGLQLEEKEKEGVAVPEGVPALPELRMRAVNLVGKITTLKENLGKTPKSWVPAVGLALEAMRNWLQGTDDPDAEQKVVEGQARYREAVTAFHATVAADPAAWHEVMATVGSLTPARARVRDLYEEALRLHWERRWDEALARLDEAAALDAQDGPVQALAERIRGYQENPPGAAWQGEFVQTKK